MKFNRLATLINLSVSSVVVHPSSKGTKIRNRYTDPGYQWESDKLTVRHHKREPRGHPFPSR